MLKTEGVYDEYCYDEVASNLNHTYLSNMQDAYLNKNFNSSLSRAKLNSTLLNLNITNEYITELPSFENVTDLNEEEENDYKENGEVDSTTESNIELNTERNNDETNHEDVNNDSESIRIIKNVPFLTTTPSTGLIRIKRDENSEDNLKNHLGGNLKNSLERTVNFCSTYSDRFFVKHHVDALRRDMFELSLKNQQYTAAQTYLAKLMKQAKNFLRLNKNIVVIPADKGGRVVIMQNDQYRSRVDAYLGENVSSGNYVELIEHVLADIQNQMEEAYGMVMTEMNQYLKTDIELKNPGSSTIRLLKPEPFVIPLFYGNPKIHKDGEPVRPIISSIDMIGDELSKWILEKLQLIARKFDKYNVKNSEELVERLKDFTLEKDHRLVLFDYSSMFTNIGVQETIEIIADNYYIIEKTTCVPLCTFIRALEFFIVTATVFQYDGKFYKQCRGLAMGNRLAQVLAEIRTNVALIQAIETFGADEISFIFKYVDDIFSAIHKDIIDEVHKRISGYVGGMQLTRTDEDENHEVEYLDCLFQRDPVKMTLTHRWAKKCYGSFATLNYHSNHSWSVKNNTVKELIRHAQSITTTNFLHLTDNLLRRVLRNSSFPEKYIDEMMERDVNMSLQRDVLRRLTIPGKNIAEQNKQQRRYISCPYFVPLKESLMKPLVENQVDVRLALRPVLTNRRVIFTKIKDHRSIASTKNAVFKAFCNDCEYVVKAVTGDFDVLRTLKNMVNDPQSDVSGHSVNNVKC